MQKTKIEWADYSWNPVKGLCPNACWYCYARAMYKRFKWNPELRLDKRELHRFFPMPEKATRIFVGSTIDLLHPEIPDEWIVDILAPLPLHPEKTFIFLTKFPARYAEFDFPKNCWLGTTVTDRKDQIRTCELPWKKKTNNFFVSIEPMLDQIDTGILAALNWIIVGSLTGSHAKQHQVNPFYVRQVVDYAQTHNIPIFLKNNLFPAYPGPLIQEWPAERD